MKYASTYCSGTIISLFRFIIGGAAAFLIILAFEEGFAIHDRIAWLARGVLGGISMSATYLGLQMTTSGEAILLVNTYPIFAVIFGVLFFKEKVAINNFLGLVLCTAGIYCVFRDSSSCVSVGKLICLGGGVLNGLAVNFVKKACVRNSPASVYFSVCVFGMLFNTPTVRGLNSIPPNIFLILICTALIAMIAQILLGYGFRYVSAAKGSIIGFLETQLTIIMSWIFIGEELSQKFLAGAAIILLGLLINQHSFTRKHKSASEPVLAESQEILCNKVF